MSLPVAIDFLALLAYPESESGRCRAVAAMRAYYLRECKREGTLETLGKAMRPEQMENQFHLLKGRLNKRLVAAHDCVSLEMGLSYEGARVPIPSTERQELLRWASTENVPPSRLALSRTKPGKRMSLTDVALDHASHSKGYERYKSDWWRPKVMHLGIALRAIAIEWTRPRSYCLITRQCAPGETDPGWVTPWPFTAETLLLLWADWIEEALRTAPIIAAILRSSDAPALRGFRTTHFLFP